MDFQYQFQILSVKPGYLVVKNKTNHKKFIYLQTNQIHSEQILQQKKLSIQSICKICDIFSYQNKFALIIQMFQYTLAQFMTSSCIPNYYQQQQTLNTFQPIVNLLKELHKMNRYCYPMTMQNIVINEDKEIKYFGFIRKGKQQNIKQNIIELGKLIQKFCFQDKLKKNYKGQKYRTLSSYIQLMKDNPLKIFDVQFTSILKQRQIGCIYKIQKLNYAIVKTDNYIKQNKEFNKVRYNNKQINFQNKLQDLNNTISDYLKKTKKLIEIQNKSNNSNLKKIIDQNFKRYQNMFKSIKTKSLSRN